MAKYPEIEERMNKRVDAYHSELKTIRAGRANASVLDKVVIDYYGSPTPVAQVGSISSPEPRMLVIQPWDMTILKEIEKAILKSEIGIAPQNDGKVIRLNFPPLTEERRKELVKQVKKMGEDGKVAIRNIRRDVLDGFKKLKTSKEITEDQYAEYESAIEKMTSKTVEAVDKVIADKEKDLLTL